MTEIIVTSNEVLNVLVILGMLGLVSMFLVKLYNILKACEFYTIQHSIISLAVGTISYIFIEMGVLVTMSSNSDAALEFNTYFWFTRIFIIMLWILWFSELFIYSSKIVTDALNQPERMTKRRNERVNSYQR